MRSTSIRRIGIVAACIVIGACAQVDPQPRDSVGPAATAAAAPGIAIAGDEWRWLEEADSAKALDWVKARNA
jgi:hypothetical protein